MTAAPQSLTCAGEAERDEAPANSLPDWSECALLVENSRFRARAAAGLEGQVLTTIGQSPEPTELHRFIYEYDDADSYRSAWFLHRLEKVLNECRASIATPPGWISVNDRLPEIGQSVALLKADGWENAGDLEMNIRACAYLSDAGSFKYWSIRGERPTELTYFTHWMPLSGAPLQRKDEQA